jgi:hypothetical protein
LAAALVQEVRSAARWAFHALMWFSALAAGAVELFVDRLAGPLGQVGDDIAGVATLWARLDTGDDAFHPAPGPGGVVKLFEPADLGSAVLIDAGDGRLLEGIGPATQAGVAGEAENEVQASIAAEIEHLGRAVVAVAAQKNLDSRPVATDLADQAPQMRGNLATFGALGRAQHGSDEPAGTVEDNDRLEAVVVVVGVE